MGVQIEESAGRSVSPAEAPLDELDFAELTVSGAEVSGEFRCADCGYGAVVQRVLPLCPMCGGTVWELRGPAARRPED